MFDSFEVDTPHVTEVRRLLQSLARSSREVDRRSYMVTSAGRGEGKSTICGLLSIVAAQIFRKRTLVIDADMRRPMMHTLLSISQKPGLFDVLRGKVPFEKALRATPIPTLHALASGRPTGSVGAAYDDDAFADLLRAVHGQFDLIFIDSAPAVPVVEPLLMAEHVDAVLLVAMAGRTPVTLIRRLRQIIAPISQKVAGVILNNAAEGLPYYYDYRYYGYEQTRTRRHRGARSRGGRHAEAGETHEERPAAGAQPGGT